MVTNVSLRPGYLFLALLLCFSRPSVGWAQTASIVPLTSAYHVARQFPVQGDGGWDYISVDSKSERIYASHGDEVEVLDASNGKTIGQIVDTMGVHGVAIAGELNRGFTSNGRDKSVTIFDLQTLKPIAKVNVNRPDFILYDPFSQRVFPLNETTSVLDATTGNFVTQLELGGDPEAAVSDGKGMIYVNLADKAAVAAIDSKELKVVKVFPVENCRRPHSLAYDDVNQRLFVGCRDNLVVLDSTNGKNVAASMICAGVDAGAFDSDSKLIFESCGEGVVSVIRQTTPDSYQLVDTAKTQLYAKTMALDPKTKRLYLPVADFESVPDSDPKKAPRTRLKAATFRILVVEP